MIYASDVLFDIEKKFDLFNLTIKDFKIWWMSRYKIYEAIDVKIKSQNGNNPPASSSKKSSSNLTYVKSLNFKKYFYKKSQILCVSGANMRREKVDGKAFDIIFDYIGKYDDKNDYAVLNTLSGTGFIKDCYTRQCYNMANITFRSLIHRKAWKHVLEKNYQAQISKIFSQVEEYLENKYNLKINLKEEVCRQTAMLLNEYKNVHRIIHKIDPKVLYVECAYSPTHLLFIYAAKNLHIPVVEYQHGLINRRHPGYIYNKEVKKSDPVPDFLCVYGAHFENMIREMNPQSNLNIIQYGNPFLYEQLINKKDDMEKNKEYDYLITTQGAMYSKYWVDFVKELLKVDENGSILMKVHPNEIMDYKELYKEIIDEKRVSFAQNMNVYDCFKVSKRHLSCFSTCHYEALTYDLPTYVIQFPGWQHVEHLKNYDVRYFSSSKKLKAFLDECKIEDNLFEKFKREFFNIEKEKLNYESLKSKIIDTNDELVNL